LLATACSDDPRPVAEAARPPLPSSTPTRAPELASGEFRLALSEGLISLEARDAPRREILHRLAEAASLSTDLDRVPERRVTISLPGVGWDRALSALLAGVPYETRFEPDPETGAHHPVELRFDRLPKKADGDATREPRPGLLAALRDLRPRPASERSSTPAERAADEARAEALSRLSAPDPDERIRFLSFLEPRGDGLQRLRELAKSDPAARVRAAAVSQLGEGESYGALEGLVEALRDPDAEVVLEAIDEIAFQDDPSLVAHLEPLLAHTDLRVAKAAGEAIAFIEY
jgi:hypothetical protein